MDGLSADDPGWIGEYRLLAKLGEGGMGRVYLARSRRGRTVAVKVVQAELARDEGFRRRFAQEVGAARRVGEEWTAPVLDADTEAETPWVATGYVAGPSLAEVVGEQYGPLPEHSVRALAVGLCHALRAIHGAGLVHRDLKPSNVLVTIDGPRVIDFGIARALDASAQSASGLTSTGVVVGSPGFMSPEQVRGERVTPASDVFCLGAVLSYTATGRLPFGTQEGGVHSLLFRVAAEDPDLRGLPESLHEPIAAALHKDPEQRPTPDALLAAFGDEDGAAGSDTEAGRTMLDGAWLPGAVLAQLGRHAVHLLDSEDPESAGAAEPADREPARNAAAVAADGAQPTGSFGPPVTMPPPSAGPGTPPHGNPYSTPHPGQPGPVAGPAGVPAGAWASPPPGLGPGPGGMWHSPPPGLGLPPRYQLTNPRGLSIALVVLLAVFAVALLLRLNVYESVESSAREYGAGSRIVASANKIPHVNTLRYNSVMADVLTALTTVPVVVLWCLWFRRLRRNAELFRPGGIRHTVSMAVGSWFIPVANLWIPKRVTNDVWKASKDPAKKRRSVLTPWLLRVWWAAWVAFLFLQPLSFVSGLYLDSSLSTVAEDAVFGQVASAIGLTVTVLAVVVVLRLSRVQEARIPKADTNPW
ncbi:protein kinase domain-containing protein [Streptomyces cacaoi]|uniref:protein kinase domain-containing protein n=1 Tax=Streptomyces cacaoi TaxID=1898 RepID=UPI00261CDF03|nr:DUF4328 domain-containing protein [Streptomyces cacaoi]